jgi:hypothetical protein
MAALNPLLFLAAGVRAHAAAGAAKVFAGQRHTTKQRVFSVPRAKELPAPPVAVPRAP